MPYKPARPCSQPGCSELVIDGSYCAEHKGQKEKARGTRQERGYDERWLRIRKAKLRHSPLCEDCLEENRVAVATQVHHIDGDNRNNRQENLKSICDYHHNH